MPIPLEHILIFKTTIRTSSDKAVVKDLLNSHPAIEHWNIDMDDADCVLRVISPVLHHQNIIELINNQGYDCSELK